MSEFLYRPILPSDIAYTDNNINNITFTYNTSYNYLDLKVNYTTTQTNEFPFFLLNKEIKAIYVTKMNYGNRIVFKDLVNSLGDRYTYTLNLSATNYSTNMVVNGIMGITLSTVALPSYDDIIFYIEEEYNEIDGCTTYYFKCKSGAISTMNNKIFDIVIDQWNEDNDYVLGFGTYQYSPVSLKDVVLGNVVQIAIDTSTLGGSSQIIDPSLSTKIISQYRNGSKIRFLTEDMVVDPIKIDVSKAITLNADAPKILTEECLI